MEYGDGRGSIRSINRGFGLSCGDFATRHDAGVTTQPSRRVSLPM